MKNRMNGRRCVLIGVAVVTLFAGAAVAQPLAEFDRGGQQSRNRPPGGGPLMRVLDTDKDGQLSAEEIGNAAEALMTLDGNGDGVISCGELRPKRPGRPGMQDDRRPDHGGPESDQIGR